MIQDIGVSVIAPLSFESANRTYYGEEGGKRVFIKEVKLRNGEDKSQAITRAENGEQIAEAFAASGLPAVVAIPRNGHFVRTNEDAIYLVYRWIDGKQILRQDIHTDDCRRIGQLLARMHNVDLQIPIARSNITHAADATLLESLSRFADYTEFKRFLEKKTLILQRIRQGIPQGNNKTISHRDLHSDNFLVVKNELCILDWEMAGLIEMPCEAADVALEWCGFCLGQTDLTRFEVLLESYFLELRRPLQPYAISDIWQDTYYSLLAEISDCINDSGTVAGRPRDFRVKRALYYIRQFNNLEQYEAAFSAVFKNYCDNCANRIH